MAEEAANIAAEAPPPAAPSSDPFDRAYDVPWDQIDAQTENQPPAEVPVEQPVVEPPAEALAVPVEPPVEPPPPDVTARIDQLGGEAIIDMIAPIFGPRPQTEQEAMANATAFVERIYAHDPGLGDDMVNAVYSKWKDDFHSWVDQDRGVQVTPQLLQEVKEWQEKGKPSLATPSFPSPDADGNVTFPDGLALDTKDPFHNEMYLMRKDRFERDQRTAQEAQAAEQTRIQEEQQAVEKRVSEFRNARVTAFETIWNEVKPNYGNDPDLAFLSNFAKVYAQHEAGSNPEAQNLFNAGLDVAQRGGEAAQARGAKLDLLARQSIKTALETIDRLVMKANGQARAATAGAPNSVPGTLHSGTVQPGAQPGPSVTLQGKRFDLNNPESFSDVRWPGMSE